MTKFVMPATIIGRAVLLTTAKGLTLAIEATAMIAGSAKASHHLNRQDDRYSFYIKRLGDARY